MIGLFAQGRELLPCPYCSEMHPEDVKACPVSGSIILLDEKYRLRRLLGEGSFGLVWDAKNIDTQKEVAIKSLRAEVISNPAVLARFMWEATAAGRIHSPHVCDVLDLVKSSAHGPYIVLERLSGRSLEALIQEQGKIAPDTAVFLLRQALVGLEAVHRAGIVHRDVKPENIFLHEPAGGSVQVKLLDFGISKFTVPVGSKAMTAADLFLGTPEYTSPEQARGASQVDQRTDIWAIGAILYRALAGSCPFSGPDVPSILTAILHTPHRPLSQVAAQIPVGLAAVVDRCLSKDRELRYASCLELRAALEPFEGLALARTVFATRSPVPSVDVSARARTEAGPSPVKARASASESLTFSLADDERAHVGAGSEPDAEGRAPVPMGSAPGADTVILSCSQVERHWIAHLQQLLMTHRHRGELRVLDFAELDPNGAYEAVTAAFARARAVVLLVSPQFLAEDFVPGSHLYSLVIMTSERDVPVLWLAIHEIAHRGVDLPDFTALGDPSRPLSALPFADADRALEAVCEQIMRAVHALPSQPSQSGPPGARAGSTSLVASRADDARDLEQRLEMVKARKLRFEAQGQDIRAISEELNVIRRALRMGRPLQHGDILDDRFVVLDQLGSGGFATVWRGIDQRTGAAVALKILHAQHVQNAERRERFFRGARIMTKLEHPNIVKIVEPWGSDGEYEFFAMQYVSGGTLRDAVISGRLSVRQRLQALLSIADALASAHERGIIHRDVKPSNILVADDDTPYLADFDLVRVEETTGGTAGGFGTVIYSAPEMMERAGAADARADVYGLGMTLAFLFHERDLTMEVIRHTDRLIDGLKVPEAIREIIRTAITWNREHRFRSAAEFRAALSTAITRRDSLPPTPLVLAPMASPSASATAPSAVAEPDADVSLIRAFAAIAKESDALGEMAVSKVFDQLEIHEESDSGTKLATPLPSPSPSPRPLPEDDRTQLDTSHRIGPKTFAAAVIGAIVLAYLLFGCA